MANTNPARGMRDFLPADVRKRNYVIGIIKEVYEKYGFEPLETPSVENLETLTGKYGDEGNQLMFKILKRGEKLQNELEAGNIKSENELSDLALRYDLTVPLARVVANYKNDLPKFFKRYQIQPVWRADRPARGRYREFYQCDVDAIGSSSMFVEAELISAVCEIFERLGFEDFVIRINHRAILSGLLSAVGIESEKHVDVLTILDKIDKIGRERVKNEIEELGIPSISTGNLISILNSAQSISEEEKIKIVQFITYGEGLKDSRGIITLDSVYLQEILQHNREIIASAKEKEFALTNIKAYESLSEALIQDDKSIKAIKEIFLELWRYTNAFGLVGHIQFDPTLARGLSYYTGVIFEVVLTKGDFHGSIGGGGRYDGLIGMFGKDEIPAVGFSLGLERILLIMEERGMFNKLIEDGTIKNDSADVMVTIWNEETVSESLKLAAELRAEGLRVLVYPEADKLGKQFKYADSINIPFVCVLGDEELRQNKVALKNLRSGEQEIVSRDLIATKILE